jgi:hypothetical protein
MSSESVAGLILESLTKIWRRFIKTFFDSILLKRNKRTCIDCTTNELKTVSVVLDFFRFII